MKSFIQFLGEDSPDSSYQIPASYTGLDKKPRKEGDKPDGTPAISGPYDTPASFTKNPDEIKPKEGDLKEVSNKKFRIWLKQLKRPRIKGKYFAFRREDLNDAGSDIVDINPTKRTADTPFTR